MAAVTIPEILASSVSFGLLRADVESELLTGKSVFTEFTKAAWTYQIQLTIQTEAQGRAWSAALSRLSRFSNHFVAGPPGYDGAAYTSTTLQVNGAGQLGTALNIKGGAVSTTVLRAGEYFSVNGELKIVVTDCVTNGSGLATVQIEPPLKASPADSANLNLATPTAKFRLLAPQTQWRIEPGRFYVFTVDAVELE